MKILEIINIQYILIYFVIVNLLAFIMFCLDKYYAKRGDWRIPEKSLMLVSFFGGSIGAILGMYIFRHKTKKLRFSIGIPIILILQIAFIIYIWYNGLVI